jgi:hypothetical protein
MSCPICINKLTKCRTITCPFCDFSSCQSCAETYITSSADDSNCMSCKNRWDREILLQLFPKVFVQKRYKSHRENVLFERELSLMPATQPLVERELVKREIQKKIQQAYTHRNNLKHELYRVQNMIYNLNRQLYTADAQVDPEKKIFLHRCADSQCRGFLSQAWKCNVCSLYTCSECNVLKGERRDDDDHVCDDNDKATFKMLKNDSKKCPGCAEFIYKVDGCDQMWCTNCHTAFSWRTGLKVNGTIHNPHYYAYKRNEGTATREIGDIPCGGLPTYQELAWVIRQQRDTNRIGHDFLTRIHRYTTHMQYEELPRYNVDTQDQNSDLRISYTLKEITDDQFKTKIQQREKATQKKREIAMIMNMFINVASEIFRGIIITKKTEVAEEELKRLVEYYNTAINTVSLRYNCVVPYFSCDYSLKFKRF